MRIISGTLRGRDLGKVPKGVRPTTDRVRESLFSVLGPVGGLRVLDLFAGTGALGLEAFSRGAERVVFVERSKAVGRLLEQRIASLGLADDDSIRILVTDAIRGIQTLSESASERFDLVLMDPPYAEDDREQVVRALFDAGLLNIGATVVVEGPKGHPLPPLHGVKVRQERRYGDTLLTWLESSNTIKE